MGYGMRSHEYSRMGLNFVPRDLGKYGFIEKFGGKQR